jgi:hypothetical protein
VLYVGITAAIQDHARDYCRRRVSEYAYIYIYPIPLGHTLKSFISIEYDFGIKIKREEDSQCGLGKF